MSTAELNHLSRELSKTNGVQAYIIELLITKGIITREEVQDAMHFVEANVDRLQREKGELQKE